MSECLRMSSVLIKDGANVLEIVDVVADLESSRWWLDRSGWGCAGPDGPELGEAWEWLREWDGGLGAAMGEGARGAGAGAKRVDLGLPGPRLGPGEGEGEAFLAKGLLRTDMARWQSGLSGREKPWDSGGWRVWYR